MAPLETIVMVVFVAACLAGVVDFGVLVYRIEAPSVRRTVVHALLWASPISGLLFIMLWTGHESAAQAKASAAADIAAVIVTGALAAVLMTVGVYRSRRLVARARKARDNFDSLLRR